MVDLQGIHVVVTRPVHQAQQLCELIEERGGQAIRFPVLEIVPKIDTEFLQLIQHLNDYHIAIFISPNAVNNALSVIEAHGGMPPQIRIAAVGKATAAALAAKSCPVHISPEDKYDSESLLALPVLHEVQDKNIIIFRGVGGRELLADTLRQRGAVVQYGECYQRRKPNQNAQTLIQHWAQHTLDIIIITSVEGLNNLIDMVGRAARECLFNTALLVVSERMVEEARQLGFKAEILCATKAGDQQLLDALNQWTQQHRNLH
ncbi:uroporphyrinogen-III synthase [Kaarinaea lacus]